MSTTQPKKQLSGKWMLLKSAILDKETCIAKNQRDISIHRHQGFNMFVRKSQVWCPVAAFRISSGMPFSKLLGKITSKLAVIGLAIHLPVVLVFLSAAGEAIFTCADFAQEMCRNGCAKIVKVTTSRKRGLSKMTIELLIYPPSNSLPTAPGIAETQSDPDYLQAFLMKGSFVLARYAISADIQIFLREKSENNKISVSELFSHRTHGVDNTGNVRVWFSEQVLLHCLLSPLFLRDKCLDLNGISVLELGGGMTGLAGIGVAAYYRQAKRVVVTDGNPDAVLNQKLCVAINEDLGVIPKGKVSCHRLMWDAQDKLGTVAKLSEEYPEKFDLIIAADCLFFEDFHFDLKFVLQTFLSKQGKVLLFQPERGNSMQNFLSKISNDFQIETYTLYDVAINGMHTKYLKDSTYNPNIHFPILICLNVCDA